MLQEKRMKKHKTIHSPVGLRTLKTAVAVSLAIVLMEKYGTSMDGLIFAVMGAFSAMEPTINGALRGCASQISGVGVGVLLALFMRTVELPGQITAGVGIILVMAFYKMVHWKSSPVLPCLILVTICTKPELGAVLYGLERLWNTAIGLGIGMLINMLVFPYDNSKKIQQMIAGLDDDLICFLEDLFDGDAHLPETEEISKKMDTLERQLELFADQRLLRRRRQKRLLQRLRTCEDTAQDLLTEMKALRMVNYPGKLNKENREALCTLGANIREDSTNNRFRVEDLVINYHVSRVLELRQQLKDELSGKENKNG